MNFDEQVSRGNITQPKRTHQQCKHGSKRPSIHPIDRRPEADMVDIPDQISPTI
jgi:hypothetical protein